MINHKFIIRHEQIFMKLIYHYLTDLRNTEKHYL